MTTSEILIAVPVLVIVGLEVAALIDRTKPWLTTRQRFFRGLVAQWQYKMFEDEATRRFLLEHEVPRLDNLISYNTQKLNQIIDKTKSPNYRNNEQDKITIQSLRDTIEAYKEAKNADIILSTKTRNARAMLLAKVDFIKRSMFNRSIPDESAMPATEKLSDGEQAENTNE